MRIDVDEVHVVPFVGKDGEAWSTNIDYYYYDYLVVPALVLIASHNVHLKLAVEHHRCDAVPVPQVTAVTPDGLHLLVDRVVRYLEQLALISSARQPLGNDH